MRHSCHCRYASRVVPSSRPKFKIFRVSLHLLVVVLLRAVMVDGGSSFISGCQHKPLPSYILRAFQIIVSGRLIPKSCNYPRVAIVLRSSKRCLRLSPMFTSRRCGFHRQWNERKAEIFTIFLMTYRHYFPGISAEKRPQSCRTHVDPGLLRAF